MHPSTHSFSRSTSLPNDPYPCHRGLFLKQNFSSSHKAPITPPLSPGNSDSSDDDYLLDEDMNADYGDSSDSQEGAQPTQPLTPTRSDFSSMHVDAGPPEEEAQPPLRLLQDEPVHLYPTGPSGIRLSDFEVRGTLGNPDCYTRLNQWLMTKPRYGDVWPCATCQA